MKTEISGHQMQMLIAMFLIGTSLISGGLIVAGEDSWFCILLGTAVFLPMLWVYTQILSFYPGRNFSEIILLSCGNFFGKIILFLYLFYALMLGGSILRTFSEFIHIVNMTSTPLLAILLSLSVTLIFISKCRLYVVARIAKFTMPFLFFSVFITVLFSIKNMDPSNLFPLLDSGLPTIAHGSFGFFSAPLGELVLCVPLFQFLNRKEKAFPVFLRGYFIGVAILLIARLRNLLILGKSAEAYTFASYEAVSVISLGEFFTRIEILIGINLLLAGFLKLCVVAFAASDNLIHLFKLKSYTYFIAPSTLLIIIIAVFISKDFAEYSIWLEIYPYFSLPFQVILPLVILAAGKIRQKRSKGTGLPTTGKNPEKKAEPSSKTAAPPPGEKDSPGGAQEA